MSTTDTRAAFEAHIQKECRNDYERNLVVQRFDSKPEEYRLEQVQSRWKTWQAATEAAKATGTAGELPSLPEPTIEGSVMHSEMKICYRALVHFTADQMREYGQACAEAAKLDMRMAMREATECAAEWKAKAEAARQPAPVVAVSLTTDQKRELLKCLNGGVEMGWIVQNNALEISSSILAGAQDQKLPVLPVKTWQERVKRTDDATAMQRRSIVARDEEIADLRAALAATAAPVLSDERIDWLANCACPGGIAYPSQVKAAIRDALREASTNKGQP